MQHNYKNIVLLLSLLAIQRVTLFLYTFFRCLLYVAGLMIKGERGRGRGGEDIEKIDF